jgi:uncharacterized protein (DUF849 family)
MWRGTLPDAAVGGRVAPNAGLVTRVLELARIADRRVATAAAVRERLGLDRR